MSLRIKLKEATRHLHDRAEQSLFSDQEWDQVTLSEYRQFLRVQYVFHSNMERSIDAALSQPLKEKLHWGQRQKQCWIRQDLEELQSPLPLSNLSGHLASPAEAFGYLYVAEGSTLGNRMIGKALKNNRYIVPHTSFRFLNGYGSETGRLWKDFLVLLENEVDHGKETTVIEAAKDAFSIFTKSVSFVKREIPA